MRWWVVSILLVVLVALSVLVAALPIDPNPENPPYYSCRKLADTTATCLGIPSCQRAQVTNEGTFSSWDTSDTDGDGDSYYTYCGQDCDDANGDVHPGVPETCNDIDDNCDGHIDEGVCSYSVTLAASVYGSSVTLAATTKIGNDLANSKCCFDDATHTNFDDCNSAGGIATVQTTNGVATAQFSQGAGTVIYYVYCRSPP